MRYASAERITMPTPTGVVHITPAASQYSLTTAGDRTALRHRFPVATMPRMKPVMLAAPQTSIRDSPRTAASLLQGRDSSMPSHHLLGLPRASVLSAQ
jgi:hypothetical protein